MDEFTGDIIIDVDHLTKDYGFGRGVFDVSIQVHRGECYGYLGPNGAGKSTTIRHIMGFTKPEKGDTKIFGISTFGKTDKILGKVGYLPGEVALPAGLNGDEFINMIAGLRGTRNQERIDYLLDRFKLNPKMSVKLMSLGDKRKLAVIAAFMDDPDVLILDEPTSGLDPIMQNEFIEFIKEEKRRGKTILMSSHIFNEVDQTCDTITIIKDGHHVSTFQARDLKRKEQKIYSIAFTTETSLKLFKAKKLGNITDEHENTIRIEINMSDTDKLVDELSKLEINKFEEVKFTLEDYFMEFYREDRAFQGLKGIEGTESKKEQKKKRKKESRVA